MVFPYSTVQAQEVYFFLPVPKDLLSFVSTNTGVTLPDTIKIGVVDNAAPVLIHQQSSAEGISFTAAGAETAGQIYLPVRSVVHMQEDKYRALIVHELTHVTQDLAKRAFTCSDQREAEAYTLQNLYLLLHDMEPVMDSATLVALQNCAANAPTVQSD